ncbi:transposase [Paenibacillus sp. NPDC055715]
MELGEQIEKYGFAVGNFVKTKLFYFCRIRDHIIFLYHSIPGFLETKLENTVVDLFNREMIGFSSDPRKTASLVYKAIASLSVRLDRIQMFHTDRGKEFDNQRISDVLETFGVTRSLSAKGCPYDNAVAEATFNIFKMEFVNQAHFQSEEQLDVELRDYVHWLIITAFAEHSGTSCL